MKRLILVGGPMGVGKSAVCKELAQLLPDNVFLDGDWCWNMHPFVVTEETKAVVMCNICDVLNRFLACSVYENIIFCWVMHQQEIIDEILSRLDLTDVRVHSFSLLASRGILKGRIMGDVLQGVRSEDVADRSLDYLRGFLKLDSEKIDTSKMNVRQVAKLIAKRVMK